MIHVVNDLTLINFGIWNAALFGSSYLNEKYKVKTCIIVCQRKESQSSVSVPVIFAEGSSATQIISKLNELKFNLSESILVTHGCWQRPTRLGYQLRKKGGKWIYSPHGMLEPWSLRNHWLKKTIYFHLIEKKYFAKADGVRAVSKTEGINLKHLLKREINVIENGVVVPILNSKSNGTLQFLFMARLHFKKGLVPLVMAWHKVMRGVSAKLVVAGPDEGELEKIQPLLSGSIEYVGPVYGEDKKRILEQSHYYLLPSLSEGFPTSVVEAMSYGLIPIISEGCNFPEVFENKLGYRAEPNEESLVRILNEIKEKAFDYKLSQRNRDFIEENYSEAAIANKLHSMYAQLLS